MENNNDLIQKLIGQHRELQKDLEQARILSNTDNPNTELIEKNLEDFHTKLMEHITIESEVFYPEVLIKMKNRGIDTLMTEAFIDEMKSIGNVVLAFLEKYKKEASIKSDFVNFKEELSSIIETLNLRIESEEEGIYMYWSL